MSDQSDSPPAEEVSEPVEQADELHPEQAPSHYVGIGASAGGLEALEAFFQNMPHDTGMAFVVIQHLSPHYKSLMVEILSKRTDMQVYRAEDGLRVEANTIYLIPPKKNLKVFHGRLMLIDQDMSAGINLPIDIFFRSLAEDQGEKAVGVILSGTGSDGMRGLRAIKEAGGMVMVQDEESAKFDGMPRSAISTGLADFILPPENMPGQLLKFIHHPYVARAQRSPALVSDEDAMTRVFAILRERTGVDFTYYKPTTISRRIERRMTINQVENLDDYIGYLREYPAEVMALHRELLIGVTSFFRDKEAFDFLAERVLPEVFENSDNESLRFWVVGCSTGEEAYSLAISCRQHMQRLGQTRDVKIFATDIDRDAVERAGAGIYSQSIAADLSPEIIQNYFVKHGDSYQVSRSIRELVVFAPHNVLKDPPFTRIDLISCRNLLIYLQPVLQKKALSLFSFSLKPNGSLFLGTSETVGDMSDHFELISNKWKIYRSRTSGRERLTESLVQPVSSGSNFRISRRGAYGAPPEVDERLSDRLVKTISETYAPAGVVVDENMTMLHVLGDVQPYFRMQPGPLSSDVTKLAAPDLAIPLATGIQKVFKSGNDVVYNNVHLRDQDPPRSLTIRIRALPERKGHGKLAAVFMEEAKSEASAKDTGVGVETLDVSKEAQQRIRDLEQELQYTKENLQATIEELETSNEELQATNEELLASNEELQSTNEELQSVNEELYTVNAEYQNKITELTDLNNDIENLMASTQIGTMFLDNELRIRKFTPSIEDVMPIMQHDVGRPIEHLAHELIGADLIALVRQVQSSRETVEREVRNGAGKWFLLRVLPYWSEDRIVTGVVVTFIDISRSKTAEADAREASGDLAVERDRLHQVMETTRSGVLIMQPDGKITFANPQAATMIGKSLDDLLAGAYRDIDWRVPESPDEPLPQEDSLLKRLADNPEKVTEVPLAVGNGKGGVVSLQANMSPITNDKGELVAAVVTMLDT